MGREGPSFRKKMVLLRVSKKKKEARPATLWNGRGTEGGRALFF